MKKIIIVIFIFIINTNAYAIDYNPYFCSKNKKEISQPGNIKEYKIFEYPVKINKLGNRLFISFLNLPLNQKFSERFSFFCPDLDFNGDIDKINQLSPEISNRARYFVLANI